MLLSGIMFASVKADQELNMDERKDKGHAAVRPSPRTGAVAPLSVRLRSGPLPAVATPTEPGWRRYCDSRLRHFASGR